MKRYFIFFVFLFVFLFSACTKKEDNAYLKKKEGYKDKVSVNMPSNWKPLDKVKKSPFIYYYYLPQKDAKVSFGIIVKELDKDSTFGKELSSFKAHVISNFKPYPIESEEDFNDYKAFILNLKDNAYFIKQWVLFIEKDNYIYNLNFSVSSKDKDKVDSLFKELKDKEFKEVINAIEYK